MTTAKKAVCGSSARVLSDMGSARAIVGSKPQREFDYFASAWRWRQQRPPGASAGWRDGPPWEPSLSLRYETARRSRPRGREGS
jgi:hypothetical protein